jgi:Skp family chaperone for outer membrane proteins
MSVIEDTRKLIQDFLAPELRSISARLDALDAKVETNERRAVERFQDLTAKVEANERRVAERFQDLTAKVSDQHQQTLAAIANLANYQAVLDRVAKLESRISQ